MAMSPQRPSASEEGTPAAVNSRALVHVLRRLVEPAPEIRDALERRRTRLLSSLVLVLLVLLAVGIVTRFLVSGDIGYEMIASFPVLALAYFTSRTRHTEVAAAIATFCLSMPCYYHTFMAAQAHSDNAWHALVWLSLPMFFASFVQGVRGTAVANSAIVVCAFVLAVSVPEILREDLIVVASMLVVVAGISIGAAAIQQRDQRAISNELSQRRAVEEELIQAKGGLEVRVAHRTSELQEANERLSALINSSSVAVIIQDRAGMIVLWNPAAEHTFGWSESEVLGKPPPLKADGGKGEALLPCADRGRESTVGTEGLTATRDGELVHVAISSASLRSKRGGFTGHMAILVDITERKSLEERLRQSEKLEAIGQLAGGVAHDFNNLLTVINGLAELTLKSTEPTDPRWGDLESIREAGERAAALTRQLLAFGRRQILRPVPLDLNEVVYDTAIMLRRLINEDVTIDIRPEPDLGFVKADRGQIEQVILNLVVNSSDAMPHGGVVRIETRNETSILPSRHEDNSENVNQWVVLEVHDEGEGISPEVKARLFEPFFTTKEVGKGTGLGLATVFGIVAQSGGDIEVESEPNEGASFMVYLPRVNDKEQTSKEEAEVHRGHEIVLIVEDEADVRELTDRMLCSLGYDVLTAVNGSDALETLENAKASVDLVLTDVIMPEMGGPECAKRIKELWPELPILYMSGHAERVLDQHGALDPGVEVLQKPFTAKELSTAIRAVLDREDAGKM